jgi:Flp pilus assembly protein TadG
MGLRSLWKRSEGQALILTAFALLLLIGLSALAVDLGMAYAVKAKLNSAVDAAALEAGRSVKSGADDNTRRQNARDAANGFFAANFTAGILGSSSGTLSIDRLENNAGTWTIQVSASAVAPTFFSRIFNTPITLASSAEATIKTLDMMIVLDCSGSLDPPSSPPGTFNALKSAAISFVRGFQEGPGGDRIGLVTFASGAVLNDPINKDANRGFTESNLTAHINATTANGATSAEEAMRIAKAELDRIPADIRSTLRVIVFFSDGTPNIVPGNFTDYNSTGGNPHTVTGGLWSQGGSSGKPADLYTIDMISNSHDPVTATNILTLPATDYTGTVNLASFNGARILSGNPATNTWCNVNKAARNMMENVANAARGGAGNAAITIYSIGLGDMLNENEVTTCAYGSSEYGANLLKRLANTADSDRYQSSQPTGTYVYAANASQLNAAFQRIRSIILRLSR